MLNRFRARLKTIIRPVAAQVARTGITANQATLLGLSTAFATPVATYYLGHIGFIVCLAMSSLFDAVDGEIARIRGRAGPLGAFIDSFSDRVSDVLYIYSLALLGLSLDMVLVITVLSLLISYARARAEGLGLRLEGVGLMERGERVVYLLILALVSMFYRELITIGSYVFVVLLLYTLIERVYSILHRLRTGESL